MAGGVLIAILAFLIKNNLAFAIIFTVLILLMAFVPIVYSYFEFQKEKRKQE